MRKNNLKIAFASLLGCCSTIIPTILLSTSCASDNNVMSLIAFKTIYNHKVNKQEENLTFETKSFKRDNVLYGNKAICDGNYILFVSSSTDKIAWQNWNMGTSIEQWQNNFVNSPIYKNAFNEFVDIQHIELKKNISNVSLLFYIDIHDSTKIIDHKGKQVSVYKKDGDIEIQHTDVSPFEKWDSNMFNATLKMNSDWISTNDTNEKDFSTSSYNDQYIRHDENAKNFRDFITRAQLLYPVNESRKETFTEKSTCVFFADGKLQNIDSITSDYWTNDFIKNFKTNFCDLDDQEKKQN